MGTFDFVVGNAVDEVHAGNRLAQSLEAAQSPPAVFGAHGELEDQPQQRSARDAALGTLDTMTHRGERRLDGIAGTDARVRSPRSPQAGKDAYRQPANAGRCHRPTDTPSGPYRAAGASTGRTPGPSGSSGAKRRLPTALQPLYQPGLGALSVEMPFSPRGDRRAPEASRPATVTQSGVEPASGSATLRPVATCGSDGCNAAEPVTRLATANSPYRP